MGDVLSLTPLIDPLRVRFPDCQLVVLTKPGSAAILRLDTRIDEVLEYDFIWSDYGQKRRPQLAYLAGLIRYIWRLRVRQFDLGIDTRGDVRSQILLSLAGCHTRIGYRRYLASNVRLSGRHLSRSLPGDKVRHRYDWNLDLLSLVGCGAGEKIPAQFPSYQPTLPEVGRLPYDRYVLIHMGGGWEFKRWSESKWVEVIRRMGEAGHPVVVVGAPADKELISGIQAAMPGQQERLEFRITSLPELVQWVANCQLFIGLDSGPMNLAVCLAKPVVALFGPGDSSMWYPYGSPRSYVHHYRNFPCNPCHQTTCYFPKHNCMSEISVEEVMQLINTRKV